MDDKAETPYAAAQFREDIDYIKSNVGNGDTADGLAGMLMVGVIACALWMGPGDFARSVYNRAVGDGPWQQRALIQYVREGVDMQDHRAYERRIASLPARDQPAYQQMTPQVLEVKVAEVLKTQVGSSGRIDPDAVPLTRLWDAAEDYKHSLWQYWVWTGLK